MLGLLLRWIIGAITLVVIAYFVPGFHIRDWSSAFIAVLVIGLLNATLGLLLKILTFPLSLLTLGLFLLVINVVYAFFDTFGIVHMLLGAGSRKEKRYPATQR